MSASIEADNSQVMIWQVPELQNLHCPEDLFYSLLRVSSSPAEHLADSCPCQRFPLRGTIPEASPNTAHRFWGTFAALDTGRAGCVAFRTEIEPHRAGSHTP